MQLHPIHKHFLDGVNVHAMHRVLEGCQLLFQYLIRGSAEGLLAALAHGSCQDNVAVGGKDSRVGVVELEGLSSRVLILDGPPAPDKARLNLRHHQARVESPESLWHRWHHDIWQQILVWPAAHQSTSVAQERASISAAILL